MAAQIVRAAVALLAVGVFFALCPARARRPLVWGGAVVAVVLVTLIEPLGLYEAGWL